MLTTLISDAYFEDLPYRDFLDKDLRNEAFRIDKRPPEVIKQVGFRGTDDPSRWVYPAFYHYTVFCSATIEGSIHFCNYLDEVSVFLKKFYFL